MITLRCTKKLQKLLGVEFEEKSAPPTAALGDWYANLIATAAGDLIIFVNERSLLVVAVPVWESEILLPLFRVRVSNLLGMLGVNQRVIAQEINHFEPIKYGNTASRKILGSMNDFAWHLQVIAEDAKNETNISLSAAELKLSQMPCKPLDYRFPAEVAKELLVDY